LALNRLLTVYGLVTAFLFLDHFHLLSQIVAPHIKELRMRSVFLFPQERLSRDVDS